MECRRATHSVMGEVFLFHPCPSMAFLAKGRPRPLEVQEVRLTTNRDALTDEAATHKRPSRHLGSNGAGEGHKCAKEEAADHHVAGRTNVWAYAHGVLFGIL